MPPRDGSGAHVGWIAPTPKRWRRHAIAIPSRCWVRTTARPDAIIRVFLPGAQSVDVLRRGDRTPLGSLREGEVPGLFEGPVSAASPYLLRIQWPAAVQETEDPYSFGPLLGELDLHLFNEGRHFELAEASARQRR